MLFWVVITIFSQATTWTLGPQQAWVNNEPLQVFRVTTGCNPSISHMIRVGSPGCNPGPICSSDKMRLKNSSKFINLFFLYPAKRII